MVPRNELYLIDTNENMTPDILPRGGSNGQERMFDYHLIWLPYSYQIRCVQCPLNTGRAERTSWTL